MGVSPRYPPMVTGIILSILLLGGYYVYTNIIAPPDPRIKITIGEGSSQITIYDDELTEEYNYTSLIGKKVYFKSQITDWEKSLGSEVVWFNFNSTSCLNAWIGSIGIPNVVKGVVKAMVPIYTRYNEPVSVRLGDDPKFGRSFSITVSHTYEGIDRVDVYLDAFFPQWKIGIYKGFSDTFSVAIEKAK